MLIGKSVEVFLFPIPGPGNHYHHLRGIVADQLGPSAYLLTNVAEIIPPTSSEDKVTKYPAIGRDVVIDTQSGGFHHLQILPPENKELE